ncbi:hypothetical protein PLCT1_00261 [Planctomycetaceae bacterium]|nr:hypothetical protein PLCT1_00261 [Planctomycetaceae bacterium]
MPDKDRPLKKAPASPETPAKRQLKESNFRIPETRELGRNKPDPLSESRFDAHGTTIPPAGAGASITPELPQVPDTLLLGFDREDDEKAKDDIPPENVELGPGTLLRHFMALGSSGSGKTVLCKAVVEECVLQGIPAICIDPQGDLCSLALPTDEPETLRQKGVDPAYAELYRQKADVVVFTPASRKGVPISADPLNIDLAGLDAAEVVRSITSAATMIVSLLGYKLDSDDGEGLVAVIDSALTDLRKRGAFPRNLEEFAAYLASLDEAKLKPYTKYLDSGKIAGACKKLARLDVGARRVLFHEGIPLSIDLLLGKGKHGGEVPGKTRVSVVYLNTLSSQEEKEFFVAALVERLYDWMLKNPSSEPQALFYIDEVAPFIPPVRKPACKDSLAVLFKQARKYGVGCLMATQNPGDVDYKAMAQFGTWGLGRLTTRQDQKKIQPTVKSLDPENVDAIMEGLPTLKPGQFAFLCPDEFDHTRQMKTRWLYTQHLTLDEDKIEKLADEHWRDRFGAIEKEIRGAMQQMADSSASTTVITGPATDETDDVDNADAEPAYEDEATEADEDTSVAVEEADEDEDPGLSEEEARAKREAELEDYIRRLSGKPAMTAREFADRAGVGEGKARNLLRELVREGHAKVFQEGRASVYFAKREGLRPDLGLTKPVAAALCTITKDQAVRIGETLRKSKTLGVLGVDEAVESLKLEYRLLLRLDFQEKVTRMIFLRLFGASHDEKLGSVYLHPKTLRVLTYSPADGIKFSDKPDDHASDIRDLDGVATFEARQPGDLNFDENEFKGRAAEETIKSSFKQRFNASPKRIEPVFVPVWRIFMREQGGANLRIVTIDGLSGKEVEW